MPLCLDAFFIIDPDPRMVAAAENLITQHLGVADWCVIKRDRGALVGAGRWRSLEVIVKWWSSASPLARLRAGLGMGKAEAHAAGAGLLLRAGIPTAKVLSITNHVSPARGQVLIMERLPGKSLLQHLADRDLTVRQEHAVARAAGALIDALSNAHLNNRDGKPSNIIVTQVSDERATLAFIDTAGVRRMRFFPSPGNVMRKNLAVEAIGCGVLPRRALLMRVICWSGPHPSPDEVEEFGFEHARSEWVMGRRADWEAIAQFIRDHGDPRPKVNPLVPRLRPAE